MFCLSSQQLVLHKLRKKRDHLGLPLGFNFLSSFLCMFLHSFWAIIRVDLLRVDLS